MILPQNGKVKLAGSRATQKVVRKNPRPYLLTATRYGYTLLPCTLRSRIPVLAARARKGVR